MSDQPKSVDHSLKPSRAEQSRIRAAHFKDVVLERLANTANVAQFVSFGPGTDPLLRHVRIRGFQPTHRFRSVDEAVGALLAQSAEHSLNVRSFDPNQPKAHDFLYGLTEVGDVSAALRRLAAAGLHTIVNETIDVNDGGVSGVSYAGLLEFAPGDTPRCVEKPGTASFPREVGLQILNTVYGFQPSLDYTEHLRIEFSIHPLKRGFRHEHTVVWEMERAEPLALSADITWPNRFSRLIGDKAFGLLVADTIGLPVPATTVIARALAPFSFGHPTGSGEHWIRTCPVEQVPGLFVTQHGWTDPFKLMSAEDPRGEHISSVLSQEGVEPAYSGAAVGAADGEIIVEGAAGSGEEFMQGVVPPQPLPQTVLADVQRTYRAAVERLGAIRFEWVHDGSTAWVVQLHRGRTPTLGRVIYPGATVEEHCFPVEEGLERLRALVERVKGTGVGIVLVGRVGVTSHLGDVLRRARIPSRIEPPERVPQSERKRT